MFNSTKSISKKIAVDNIPPRKNVAELFMGLEDIRYKNDNRIFKMVEHKYYDNVDSYCIFSMDEIMAMSMIAIMMSIDNNKEELFYKKDIISNMHRYY